MKKILVSMLAVAAMVACSTEDTLVQAPVNDAIGFDTFVNNSTRANDVTTETIEDFGFGVYASVTNGAGQSGLILDNEKVTFDGNDWGYTNTQYWVAGNDYNFAAIAPFAGAKWTYTPANGTAQNGVIAFDNAAAAANQDLVFATAAREVTVAPTSKPDAVAFTFGHLLSRVRFSFANGFESAGNIVLAVSNVHITDAYANGTIEVAAGEVAEAWTPADKNLDVVFGDVATEITEGKKQSTEHFYLIPNADFTSYVVTFDVTLFQAGVEIDTYSHTVALKCAMERGASYDIKTTLNPQNTSDEEGDIYPIEFTVNKVENWTAYDETLETKQLVKVDSAEALAEALEAGESVKLTADINLDEIATTRAAYDSYGLVITKDCIIDGAGHTITTSVKRAIAVCEPVNVTLKNFTLNAGGERGIQVETAANVVVEDVVATAKNYTLNNTSTGANANITINNCDFSGLNVINVWGENAVVNINNTTLRCKDDAEEGYSVVSNNGKNAVVNVNGGEVVINGSNSEGTTAGAINEEDAQVNFVGTAGNPVVVTAYFAINYADNTRYTFTTFEEALETAVAGETIVMINDLTTDKTLKVTKKVTLDLNGKSLNVTNPGVSYTDAITATTGAELTITGNGIVSADWGAIVAMKDAKVVVVNGTFYGNESEVVFVQNEASVEILGGSFKQNEDPSITLNKLDKYRNTTSIVVKGGQYFQFNPANNTCEGEGTSFVADGYTVEQNGDWYIVK